MWGKIDCRPIEIGDKSDEPNFGHSSSVYRCSVCSREHTAAKIWTKGVIATQRLRTSPLALFVCVWFVDAGTALAIITLHVASELLGKTHTMLQKRTSARFLYTGQTKPQRIPPPFAHHRTKIPLSPLQRLRRYGASSYSLLRCRADKGPGCGLYRSSVTSFLRAKHIAKFCTANRNTRLRRTWL